MSSVVASIPFVNRKLVGDIGVHGIVHLSIIRSTCLSKVRHLSKLNNRSCHELNLSPFAIVWYLLGSLLEEISGLSLVLYELS